jgi:ABC-type multidrug transport system ATPase subunit
MVGDNDLLRCRNLSRSYGDIQALSNVSFSVRTSELVFVCGHNGSGKSTLIKLIAGTEDADPGADIMFGFGNQTGARRSELGHQQCIWVPQRADDAIAELLFVREAVSLACAQRVEILAKTADAQWLLDTLRGSKRDRLICELSGGEKQLLIGILSLSLNRRILLLDEVFSHLDECIRTSYWHMVKDAVHRADGCAVIVCHDLEFAYKNATRIIVLRKGMIELDERPSGLSLDTLARLATGIGESSDSTRTSSRSAEGE